MGIISSSKKRLNWLKHVSFDKSSGFYKYRRFDKSIYIRHPRHYLDFKQHAWCCENIFFYHYCPNNNDTVLDLGAGYGEESVWLHKNSPSINYIGVEVQPVIYECLSNTYNELSENFSCYPYAITDMDHLKLGSQFSYASSATSNNNYIYIPTISWADFLTKTNTKKIDLFKMNIEGAEKDILQNIDDFSLIKRFIISCHDFRANHGEGEHFRSKAIVTDILEKNGYSLKTFDYGINWADDWIYAERV